jgi:Fe2+ transport system protein B
MDPEQRRRIEEEEARREAERAQELARQRALLGQDEADAYVMQRVRQEMEAITEAQRAAEEEDRAQSGSARASSPYLLLLLGLAISAGLLYVMYLVGRG